MSWPFHISVASRHRHLRRKGHPSSVFVEALEDRLLLDNEPPTAVDDYLSTPQDTEVWIPGELLLENDFDVDENHP